MYTDCVLDTVLQEKQHAIARHDAVVTQCPRESADLLKELTVAQAPLAVDERNLCGQSLRRSFECFVQ
jgi:hypothetical protein